MTLQPSFTSMVDEDSPSRASLSAQRNLAKLELSDGSNIYAKLVVISACKQMHYIANY